MKTYKVHNLDSNTPKSERIKLEKALNAIKGTESVRLRPEKSEVAISFHKDSKPSEAMVEASFKNSGFTVGAPAA